MKEAIEKATFEVEVKRNGKWELFESCETKEEAIQVAKSNVNKFEAARVMREQWDNASNAYLLKTVFAQENSKSVMKKGWVVDQKTGAARDASGSAPAGRSAGAAPAGRTASPSPGRPIPGRGR